MPDVHSIINELDAWAEAGRTADFWWRDDDAPASNEAMQRLIELSVKHQVSCGVAVVPSRDLGYLKRQLDGIETSWILQHGYSHTNYAKQGDPMSEYNLDRPIDTILAETGHGYRRLEETFGPRFLPFMVPPWNKIDPALIPGLRAIGIRGLSTHGSRPALCPSPEVTQFNVHCSPITWTGGNSACFSSRVWREILDHLQNRRNGTADPDEPTGLMTHHWAHDEESWRFVDQFLDLIKSHPAASWVSVRDLLEPNRARELEAPRLSGQPKDS